MTKVYIFPIFRSLTLLQVKIYEKSRLQTAVMAICSLKIFSGNVVYSVFLCFCRGGTGYCPHVSFSRFFVEAMMLLIFFFVTIWNSARTLSRYEPGLCTYARSLLFSAVSMIPHFQPEVTPPPSIR